MKEYSVNVKTKKNETFLDILGALTNYDCEIFIDKRERIEPYVFNFSEVAYYKLGEKRGRTMDEYKNDINFYNFISKILSSYGLSDKHKGFRYSIECIRLMNMYGVEKYTLDKDVYPVISKWYNVTPACIEHNIRNAINIAWELNKKSKNRMNAFDIKPTNLRFLRHISELVNCSIVNAKRS